MRKKLEKVPELPGVYFFKSLKGEVLYVGKAKNLKKRLSSHLNSTDPSSKSYRIVKASSDFEYLVVRNEREALELEAELIKEFLPKFNVLLKDDKTYPFLVITDEDFPTVKVIRKSEGEVKGERFGPFIPPRNAKRLKELIHKVFKLRKCKELKKRDKPCLEFYIDRCTAPCCGKVSKEDYRRQVEGALSFLKGSVKGLIKELYREIEEASERLQFERAALLRDQLIALKNLYERSSLLFDKYPEGDFFYLEKRGELFVGTKLTVRNGILYGKESFKFDPIDPWEEGFFSSVVSYGRAEVDLDAVGTMWLKSVYARSPKPEKVYGNFNSLSDEFNLLPFPRELLPLIKRNSEEVSYSIEFEPLASEFESLFYRPLPERIEGFDISTLYGEATVASCVVWERGEFKKGEYRRYRVKSVKGVDDYASMEEVLRRRFKRIKKGEVKPPQLVLVDGGVGQLKVAIKVRDELGLDFPVFSLAKKEEILFTDDGEVVRLKEYPYLFRLFASVRDEAHRFALSYNRKLREKKMLSSPFDNIKGLGKKRRELLARFYPDPKELSLVEPKELVKIGIPLKVAQEVVKRARELFL
ncbi:excinuclease ABC subunit UvrC [Thermovibrio sp.]